MRPSRTTQNAVIAAAIVAELVLLVGHPLFGWGPHVHRPAATPPGLTIRPAPPPSTRSVLLGLSAAATRLADRSAPGHDEVAYVSLRTWQLSDQLLAGRPPTRPLTRLQSAWRTANGSGHLVTVAETRHGSRTETAALAAGDQLPALTGPPAVLDRRLGLGPRTSTETAVLTFAAIATREPIPPTAEAEILRLLAGDAGLADAGTTRDHAGRPGVAIVYTASVDGTAIRDTLVFARATGALQELDRTLAGPPGHLDVSPGALLSETVYLRSAWVPRIGALPSG